MADKNTPDGDNSTDNSEALQPDEGAVIPRVSLKETGFSALKVTSVGRIVEEAQQQFRTPNMYKVVAEMNYSPAVATGMNALNTLICSAEPRITPLPNENDIDKERRYFLQTIFGDMDNSFQSTMQGIVTYMKYGYQVSEMVFRRRLKRNGSKYDDGLVGLKGLKNRPQNSIRYWTFAEDGRELVSISQSLDNMPNSSRFSGLLNEQGCITIPRDKFILFRCDPIDDNPEGRSVLQAAYLPYKQLTLLTDHLMTGAAKDLGGIPFAQLPPQYMNPEANAADKAVYTQTQTIIDQLAKGQTGGIIFPKLVDPTTNADLFTFSILEQKTGNAYDIESVIKTLQANILSVLGCGSVTMNAADAGSFSTQDSNTNILALTVKYRLEELANEMNKSLVPKIWQLNGWDTSRMPSITFNDPSSASLEEVSKFLQRVAAVGLLEVDRGMLNVIREMVGFEPRGEDEPIDEENLSTTLSGKSSSSGEGMAVGVNGDGTSKAPTKRDNSAANSENKG